MCYFNPAPFIIRDRVKADARRSLKESLSIFPTINIIVMSYNPNLTKSLQSFSHRHLVADLSIFYRYFHGHCSLETRNIIPDPVRRARTTRSSTQSHPFQVVLPNPRNLAHKSSFIPRTS